MSEPFKSPVELEQARYTQPDILGVTGVKKGILQTWVNRGHIALTVQNPGYGKKRRYSAIDALKIAIMSHFNDMSLPVSAAKGFAEDMVDLVIARNKNESGFNWEEVFAIDPHTLKLDPERHEQLWWQRWGGLHQNLNAFNHAETHIALLEARGSTSANLELDEIIEHYNNVTNEPMTEQEWRALSLKGVNQPSSLLVPIGYIVNSVLCRLDWLGAAS